MDTVNSNILLVRVPTREAANSRELRDYILESLERGVLVLTEDASCEVLELPPLGGVVVESTKALPAPELEDGDTPASQVPAGRDADMKRVIVQRLKDYRAAHGLGSLEALSAKTAHQKGRRIPAEMLRHICGGGAPKMELSEWQKIARALDVLESQD